ncbi:M56 family metallopeptidase [Streptomyces sp. NPDC002514]|uniref:M56 family metallopeptidase n=1 Tax=unclassified Streptomyces TaxID=2593676 RepID=UPI0036AFD38F
MRIALLLSGYIALLGVLVPGLLVRGNWMERAPRLGIWVWQALTVSVLSSVVLAGVVLAVPTVPVSGGLATMLQACVMALRAQYATPGGAAIAATGTVVAAAVLGRTVWCLSGALLRARRERSRHARVLSMVGRARPDLGVTVLDDDRPAAYCLPGYGNRIVLTTAALAALEPRALDAVIAHERAHIRGRHHLVLAFAEALERAFPRVPLFRTAAAQTRGLVEMDADNVATVHTDAVTLAGALLEMAGTRGPAVALAAGGDVARRVRRLLGPQRPLGRLSLWGGVLLASAVLVLPLVLAAEPAVAAMNINACPLPIASAPTSVSAS